MKERVIEFVRDIFKTTSFKRRPFFMVEDILLTAFSMYASFWIRFDGIIPENFLYNLRYYILMALAVKLSFLMYYNLYGIPWRFFNLRERVYLYL